jgi:hypothetical protein
MILPNWVDVDIKKKIIKYSKLSGILKIAVFGVGIFIFITFFNSGAVKGSFDSSENNKDIKASYSVVIKDSEKLFLGKASSIDKDEILSENNVKYWPEDIISTELILDPIQYNGAGRLVAIKRAPVFYVKVDSKIIEVRGCGF